MDKGNVASGRDRDASARRARIAAGWRVESPAVSRGMGVGDTVEALELHSTRLIEIDSCLTVQNSKFYIAT